MYVTIGTFNLNNLFSRYNFKGEIDAFSNNKSDVHSDILFNFDNNDFLKVRTYKGKLVKAKDPLSSQAIADRILKMNLDILAVQEVEDIDTLLQFNRKKLNDLYPNVILIEGNDPRLIDVGLLSKLPIGGVTSWQYASHPDDPNRKIFGRDLLEVQILNPKRTRRLFTIFNNHLKSHYIDFRDDPIVADKKNRICRYHQSETIAKIVKARTRPGSKFVILGDMNDPPDSPELMPFVNDSELNLTNALANPSETRPAKADYPPPASTSWTHRFKPSGKPAQYELYDHIWLSHSLAKKQTEAWIDRRTKHGGNGSDHDPGWIEVKI